MENTMPPIPDFLKRKPGEAPKLSPKPPRKPRPKKATTNMIEVHLDRSDIRGLGSGRRLVELVKLGRKWVTIRLPGRTRGQRIRRSTWEKIKCETT